MAIYLVQHGKSLPKEQDPQKGLSSEGVKQTKLIAQVAAQYNIQVTSIAHSGKTRAAQTAQIFADALHPLAGVRTIDGIAPMDDVWPFATSIDIASDELIIGHLPFMERLVAYLITGQFERPVFRMQNSGIICLDHYPDTTQIVIKWALMPNVGK